MTTTNQTSKIALVTGGSRGIGKSIALNLAKRGIGVILTYHNNPEKGEAVADEINRNGGKAVNGMIILRHWLKLVCEKCYFEMKELNLGHR